MYRTLGFPKESCCRRSTSNPCLRPFRYHILPLPRSKTLAVPTGVLDRVNQHLLTSSRPFSFTCIICLDFERTLLRNAYKTKRLTYRFFWRLLLVREFFQTVSKGLRYTGEKSKLARKQAQKECGNKVIKLVRKKRFLLEKCQLDLI